MSSNVRRLQRSLVFVLLLQFMNKVWVPGEKQRTKATFLSSKALDCAVPSLSSTAVNTEDFMMDDKPYARWEIKAKAASHINLRLFVLVFSVD